MFLFWDTIIIMFLLASLLLTLFLLRHLFYRNEGWWNRHPRMGMILLTVLLFFFGIISWGSFLEPEIIIIKYQTADIGLGTPVRVALISDVQTGPYKKEYFVQKLAEKLAALNPDLILYPGDFVMNEETHENEARHWQPIAEITDSIPFIGVSGNHEYGYSEASLTIRHRDVHEETERTVESLGVVILRDEEVLYTKNGKSLRIIGLEDLWSSHYRVPRITPDERPTLAFTHNPDMIYFLDRGSVDLLLAAHTHGGQIRLPVVGPLGLAGTRLPKELYKGPALINDVPLYVTSGLGESGPRARLFNLPEIVMIELR